MIRKYKYLAPNITQILLRCCRIKWLQLLAAAKTILALALLFTSSASGFKQRLAAQEQESIASVRKVIAKLQSRVSFRANLQITLQNAAEFTAVLSYQNGKIHLQLNDGRVVATNGIYMIAYNPNSGVAGKQLVEEKPSGGPNWLLNVNEYNYEFPSETQALGRAQNPHNYIQQVQLEWDANYDLQRISLQRKNDLAWFHLRLGEAQTITNFSPTLFSYRPPTGSRTVENVLQRRN